MEEPVHVAITRTVREAHVGDFERLLTEFARRSLEVPGSRGVHVLYPAPGSASTEYGIMRSFASPADRDAFYATALYKDWLAQIEPMVEGPPRYRDLSGLEAWFREGGTAKPPPRWKMALLTWIAVWPVSMVVPALVVPLLAGRLPGPLVAGAVAAGIVVTLTWGAMPILTKVAHGWIHPPLPAGASRAGGDSGGQETKTVTNEGAKP